MAAVYRNSMFWHNLFVAFRATSLRSPPQLRRKPVMRLEIPIVTQPDVSKMLRGDFRQFSVERLLKFLVALDQDVEIVVKPHRDTKNAPALHVSRQHE